MRGSVRLNRDALLICAAALLRSMATGLLGVILAIYLAELGWSTAMIGFTVGAGLAGAAGAIVVTGLIADRVGRRRMLVLLALVSAAGCGAFGALRGVILIAVSFVGMVNGMGRDRGPASALEQAILPETCPPEQRTWTLAWYNVVLDTALALGALAGMTPTLLIRFGQLDSTTAHRATVWLCATLLAAGAIPYALLSPRVEVARAPTLDPDDISDREARALVRKIALLFGIDSIGGGFLGSSLIAFWFFQRYGTAEAALAAMFFAARVLNTLSHLMAAWLSRRIGLVNTMVFTHMPSSLLLMTAPIAPSAWIAAALFLARESLVEMDVPTRQSYVMAIVPRERRTFASGVTNLTRTIGWAIGPSIAGLVMKEMLAAPLLIGGGLKIAYDVLLYRSFRSIKAPEENASQELVP